ncbi:hypothetical protein E0Z10_g10922 [Xylaria hypoxylon]|uniref:Rhodopsin domain-containing protein n=1 Tax=Xylaria hypoxylon TaxID=37992 RepID=A0A4Z0YAN5_9PEZI|nr:hypothetical protein E0Z10_g10922 [Xylaria hypoxylon]
MPTAYTPEKVIPVYATLTGIGIALTVTRLWVRTQYIRVSLAADDAAAVAAAVFVTGAVGLQITNAILGTAGDDVKLAETQRRARIALKANWINPLLEAFAFGLIKLSLSFFYRRIFGVWPTFRRINNAVIILLAGYSLAFGLGQLFLCGTNFYLIWVDLDQHTARERCAERGHFQFFFALFSVLTDILVVGLPLLFVAKLHMSTRRKWASAVVFFLGFASTGASIARLIYVSVALKYGWFSFNFKPAPGEPAVPSPIFETLNPTLLATIEMGLGLWGANLPALSPLMRNVHPLRLVGQLYGRFTSLWTSTSTSITDRQLLSTEESKDDERRQDSTL